MGQPTRVDNNGPANGTGPPSPGSTRDLFKYAVDECGRTLLTDVKGLVQRPREARQQFGERRQVGLGIANDNAVSIHDMCAEPTLTRNCDLSRNALAKCSLPPSTCCPGATIPGGAANAASDETINT